MSIYQVMITEKYEKRIAELETKLAEVSKVAAKGIAALAHISHHAPGLSCNFCKDDYAVKMVDYAKNALIEMQ